MNRRNIIFGIDGVPFNLMNELSEKNIMPNFKDLKKDFEFRLMRSSIPHISSVSWSSIITGKNPGEHGIFGFTGMVPNTYSLNFPNFNALKSKPFWHQKPEKKHVIINVPSTYPTKELNGIHVAGFVALDLERAVYPRKYIHLLEDIKYEIDVDSSLAHQQSKDVFFDELFRVLESRKKSYELFWEKIKWDTFMFVITGSDRIGHFLWHAYEDEENQYHQRFLDYFHEIDNIIGEIYSKINEDDTFMLLSDHGMELSRFNVNLNTYLEEEGFLTLSDKMKRYNRIEVNSKAFSLDPGRIYLNKMGKYPKGMVKKEDEKEVVSGLKNILYDLKYQNKKVIKKIYEKSEIYHGQCINKAPDLVLIENEGFNLKGSIGKENIFEEEMQFSGKHNENAFICINKEIKEKIPTVEDIVGLLS